MKVGILTFHRADNYGALLQTFALQTVLQNMGNEVSIIDYRCIPLENDYIKFYSPYPPRRRNKIKWIFELFKRKKCLLDMNKKRLACDKFRCLYLNLEESVKSNEDRNRIGKSYGLIITGSDQIWSYVLTHGKDDWYTFKKDDDTSSVIVSYAASVGNLIRFSEHFSEYFEDLENYDYLSVRERDLQKYLSDNLKRKIYRVLDPTLLIEVDQWNSMIDISKIPNEPYILFYEVEFHEEAYQIAKEVARIKKLPIVHFEAKLQKKSMTIYAQSSSPLEFLGLVKNACYIVTSSFHGTVFSILFKKQFLSVLPNKVGGRITEILLDFGLEDRIVDIDKRIDTSIIDSEIDFSKAQYCLDKLKDESFCFLKECIAEAERRSNK